MANLRVFGLVLTTHAILALASGAHGTVTQVFDEQRVIGLPEVFGGAETPGFVYLRHNLIKNGTALPLENYFEFDDVIEVNEIGPLDPALLTLLDGFVGRDLSRISVNVAGGNESTDPLIYLVRTTDLQLLTIESEIDTQVVVDMSFSQSVSLVESAGGSFDALSFGRVNVLDSTTFDVPFGNDSTLSVFESIVRVDTEGEDEFVGTVQLGLHTNRLYWVAVGTLFRIATSGDVGSILVSGEAVSDPIFSINESFADENPDLAIGLRIDRDAVGLPEAVDMVIKPGDEDAPCFNQNGHGVIPVAILGNSEIDVSQIDTNSLSFGGLGVRIRGNSRPMCSLAEIDDDSNWDLLCHFQDDSALWVPGDGQATLSGELVDGTAIEGQASICVVPKKGK